uniref:Uncharacterized protein n=1 Tax=Rhizophora mucronata TaxID=61149 RepID=A0A2P2NHV5_RHIMU
MNLHPKFENGQSLSKFLQAIFRSSLPVELVVESAVSRVKDTKKQI